MLLLSKQIVASVIKDLELKPYFYFFVDARLPHNLLDEVWENYKS
jgi:hypothetical protein